MAKGLCTRGIYAALVVAGLAVPAWVAAAEPVAEVPVVVPAGTLDQALTALATQSGIQILYAPALVAGRQSHGLRITRRPLDALKLLLRDTGLEAVRINANTFVLQRVATIEKPHRARAAVAPSAVKAPLDFAPILVTGTHIVKRGLEAVSPAPLTLITREEIEASGHQTLFEVLRSQPGMVGHHPVDVAADGGQPFQQPFAAASTTSLNALGPRATLFLIDGRRMAKFGLISSDLGGLVDLDAVPLSIVDRIEIIRGGASAIYGADAMAGVVNIILRKEPDENEVVARYGVSERGDAAQRRLSFSLGRATPRGGSVLLAGDYYQREALAGTQRSWRTLDHRRHGLGDWRIPLGFRTDDGDLLPASCLGGTGVAAAPSCLLDPPLFLTLQPATRRLSLYAHGHEPIAEGVELHADVRTGQVVQQLQRPPFYARINLPDGHPDIRVAQDARTVDYAFFEVGPVRSRSENRSLDASIALKGSHGAAQWTLSLMHQHNTVSNHTDGLVRDTVFSQAVRDGRYRFDGRDQPAALLAEISPRVTDRGEASLDQLAAGFNGPVFSLPAGEVKIATGIEIGREGLDYRPDPLSLEHDVALNAQRSALDAHRYSSAFYAEASVPLWQRLHADLAWRVDHRQGYGSKASPQLGLKWRPHDSLTFRGTVATGYRAPSLFELRRPNVIDEIGLIALTPTLAPCALPLELSDGNTYCLVQRSAIDNPELRPETSRSRTLGLVWAPSRAFSFSLDHFWIQREHEIVAVNALADAASFPRAQVRDEDGLLIGVNDYFENVGHSDVRGWELDARYRFDTERFGSIALRMAGNTLARVARKTRPSEPALNHAGHGAPSRTGLASVEWGFRDWTTTLNLHGVGPAHVAQPGQRCPTRHVRAGRCTTPGSSKLDLHLSYAGFERWQLSLNVQDLADRRPVNYEIDNGGYDIAFDDPRGRYYLFSVAYRF
ncbi:MAG: TonB-dependent receptor domain-containing protein [Lysobacter sp.]